jgi:hypothetical protein
MLFCSKRHTELMQRATTRSFFNPSTARSAEQILSLFQSNKQAMTPFIASAMMRNLGLALRQKRPENKLDLADSRFNELVQFQLAAISDPAASGVLVTAVAEGFATFPANEAAISASLAPLAERTALAAARVIGNLSPDQLSVLVRALSFRGPEIFGAELRKLMAREITAKVESLAHHNVREIIQALRTWPVDAESAKIGSLLLRRLRNSLGTISGSDALKLLVVMQKAPNYVRTAKGDVKPRLLEQAAREFETFTVPNKLQFLELCSENRQLLSDEQIKATTKRLAAIVPDLEGPKMAEWLKTVAALRAKLNDFDAVVHNFCQSRMADASFREKIDALWAVARMRDADDANFAAIFAKTIKADAQLKLDDDRTRLFQLLDILAVVGVGKFPISWSAVLAKADEERVALELRSKVGQTVERNLPAGFAKNGAIGDSGIYRAPFYNAAEKVAVDIEPRNFKLLFNLRQKAMLKHFGVRLVVIPDGAFLNRKPEVSEADLVNSFLARANRTVSSQA